MCEIETRTVYFSIVCDRKIKNVQKKRKIEIDFYIQSEDLDMIYVSKKVYMCAYLSIDKTDE